MISKFLQKTVLFLTAFSLIGEICIMAQGGYEEKTLYDINGEALMIVHCAEDSLSAIYDYVYDSDTLKAISLSTDIVYNCNGSSLKNYIDERYGEYFEEHQTEHNTTVFIHILFDSSLNIVEIRNMTTGKQDKSLNEIDSLFKRIV